MSQTLSTVSNFNLEQYLGTWYDIARLPMKHQPEDSTDISAVQSLNENGKLDEAIAEATIVDAEHAKLEVSFLPEGLRWIPFTKGDYWVLKIVPDYQTALVGEPNKEYLWLLHRNTSLDAATQREYLSYAESLGYDLSDLIHTVHTGHKTV